MPRRRQDRRDFREVAQDAIKRAAVAGTLDADKARNLLTATKRPRHLEQIRAAFVQDVAAQDPQALKLADVAGKIDFDSLLDALTAFFPKLANLKKFAPLFKVLIGLAS